ncbi:DNA alkylation repair enzyme [Brevinema andersonii]|uniref:DNA alkylation repair enzyme n=1 Tax=Brevinema andersonii TaxID=34097 RepID=A0A1I1DX28_BREAD|nr:DNA alkylation repair enzyme [Brevinema andersonii]
MEGTLLYWNHEELFWYKRIAIIVQLRWKENTNTNLLSHVILDNKNYNEFFVQKAIGWILREYSKTNPDWIYNFINIHSLKITTREVSKISEILTSSSSSTVSYINTKSKVIFLTKYQAFTI